MKTLVERIRNRELAIENDGSLEELRKAVKYIFPNSILDPHGNVKYYFAEENDFDSWNGYSDTYLSTVSVKEVLAEIEGESKETKVIYLNEEDKPKVEEPLTPFEWYNNHSPDSDNFEWCALKNSLFEKNVKEYAEYRNNFKPNDKPIEFEKVYILSEKDYQLCDNPPSNMDLVIVVDKENFIGIKAKESYAQWRFKGNLNNGKVN